MKFTLKLTHLFLLFFFCSFNVFSQRLNYILQPANPYKMQVIDVFNLTVFNPSNQNVNIILVGKIELQGTGIVAEMKTRALLISPGNNKLIPDEISMEYVNFTDQSIQQFENQTGSLPPGNYRFCISPACPNPNCDGLGASFVYQESPLCKDFTILLPSPLLLNFPKDAAEIENTRPQLTWIPPMPIAAQQELTYKLRLVEKNENQSAIDALSRNRPLLEQSGIEGLVLNYPPDMDELDTSKKYAWQVEAYSGNLKIATSQAWYFKFKQKEKKIYGNAYFYPKKELGLESYQHSKQDTLMLVIKETYYSDSKKWTVQVEEETETHKTIDLATEVLIKPGGINFMILPETLRKLKSGVPLLVTLRGNDNQVLRIRLVLN